MRLCRNCMLRIGGDQVLRVREHPTTYLYACWLEPCARATTCVYICGLQAGPRFACGLGLMPLLLVTVCCQHCVHDVHACNACMAPPEGGIILPLAPPLYWSILRPPRNATSEALLDRPLIRLSGWIEVGNASLSFLVYVGLFWCMYVRTSEGLLRHRD